MSQLRKDEQAMLLQVARGAVSAHLSQTVPEETGVASTALMEPRGVFVSIYVGEQLRGCIGNIAPSASLYRITADCAVSAAVADPRFPRLTHTELDAASFEISVLSSMERITRPDDIEIGIHGLMITKMRRRGLLLPQVASHQGWGPERFLSETCRKAGLLLDDWKEDAVLYRFTAQVFGDEKIRAA